MMRTFVAALCLATAAVACGGGSDGDTLDLEGTEWVVTALRFGGTEVPALDRALVTVTFAGGRVFGEMGCNGYGAGYLLDGASISFEEPVLTGAACPDPAVTAQEGAFRAVFFGADQIREENDGLVLATGGDVVVRLTPAAPLPLEEVRWVLTSTLEGTEITLLVGTSGSVSGSTGCNEFLAEAETGADGVLVLSAFAVTERACLQPDGVMDQEQAYLDMLRSIVSYRTTLTRLELIDGAGDVAAEFRFAGRL